MSAARKSPLRRGPGRALLRIHRRIGIALSGVFIVICLTGILLNHTADLDLDNKKVEADWIYDWYGFEPKSEITHFRVGTSSVSHLSETLYFNATPIASASNLIGAVATDAFIVAATNDSLVLISPEGELVEILRDAALPAKTIARIQISETNQLLLDTELGIFESDQEMLAWHAAPNTKEIATPIETTPTPELQATLLSSFRGKGLSWNRVILDIHSGRFFGSFGKWIADLSALGLIILTLSGIYYTMKYLKKARERAR